MRYRKDNIQIIKNTVLLKINKSLANMINKIWRKHEFEK